MTDENQRHITNRAISRRTALVGCVGGVAGLTVGHDRLLSTDESAFAETNLEVTAGDVTVDTACGRVSDLSVSEDSEVTFEYENVPVDLTDGFELTLEANPHVGGRDNHDGWSEPNAESGNIDPESDMDGSGTETDPYKITTDQELQAMTQALDAHYELENNIDASETHQWNGGDGFDPIWDSGEVAFSGSLEGNGHKVCGVTIAADDEAVGLIGANQGTIQNVGLVDCSIDVDEVDDVVVGGLTGVNSGTIVATYSRGVTIEVESDLGVVGGLVGINDGEITNTSASGTIDVDTGDFIVGGSVGGNFTTESDEGTEWVGTVTDSYAAFDISVTFESGFLVGDSVGVLGGFVGFNTAVIANSYSRGTSSVDADGGLTADTEAVIGGFVGANFTEDEDPGLIGGLLGLLLGIVGAVLGLLVGLVATLLGLAPADEDRELVEETPGEIHESYSAVQTVELSGDIDEGAAAAFAGGNEGNDIEGVIMYSYWDEERLSELAGIAGEEDDNDGDLTAVSGLVTDEMQGSEAENNLAGLDFDETWMTIEDPDDYPQLRANSELPEESGEQTGFDAIFQNEPLDGFLGDSTTGEATAPLSDIVGEDVSLALVNHEAIDGGDDSTAYRQFEPYPSLERRTEIDFKLIVEHVTEDIETETETDESATIDVRIPGMIDE